MKKGENEEKIRENKCVQVKNEIFRRKRGWEKNDTLPHVVGSAIVATSNIQKLTDACRASKGTRLRQRVSLNCPSEPCELAIEANGYALNRSDGVAVNRQPAVVSSSVTCRVNMSIIREKK